MLSSCLEQHDITSSLTFIKNYFIVIANLGIFVEWHFTNYVSDCISVSGSVCLAQMTEAIEM